MRHLLFILCFLPFILTAQDTDPDEGWQPVETGHGEVSLLKGSASYAYPIWTPKVRGAVNLPLELVYNSSVVNSMTSEKYTDTGWVGVGWQLSLPTISVKKGVDSRYNLSLNGISSPLLAGDDGYLYPQSHPFIRVETHDGGHDAPHGETDDHYFIATDTKGTRYYFGEAFDGNGLLLENSEKATLGFTRNSGQRVYRVFKLWKIEDRTGNILRITYDYGYLEQGLDDNDERKSRRKESHPRSIQYTTNPAAGDNHAEYEIFFDIQNKNHPIESTYGEVKQYLNRIDVHYHDTSGTRTLFTYTPEYSQYGDNHEAGRHILLDRIHHASEDPTLGVETTEFAYETRDIHSTYGFENPSECGDPPAPYPCGQGATDAYSRAFLTHATDHMGKTVVFQYGAHPEVKPTLCATWGNPRSDYFAVVTRKTVIDAITGVQSVNDYHYREPYLFTRVKNEVNDIYSADFGTFGGFAKVWVVDPEDKVSEHHFNAASGWSCSTFEFAPLAGRLTQTTQYGKVSNRNPDANADGQIDSAAYQQTAQSWAQWTGNPGNHWPNNAYFVYMQGVTETQWGNSYPATTHPHGVWTHTTYSYDDYGNLRFKTQHETSTQDPATLTPPIKSVLYTDYKAHPNRWLVLPSFENLYEGTFSNENLFASTVFLYDTDGTSNTHDFNMLGQLNPNSQGILNRKRQWADERYFNIVPPTLYHAFNEESYTYDAFGNPATITRYYDEGSHMQEPPYTHITANNIHRRTTITYGPNHQLAVDTLVEGNDGNHNTIVLNHSTTQYDHGLQLATASTDALGRTNTTGYDAFMRPITTQKPAHYEQGIFTTEAEYPSYNDWQPLLNQPFTVYQRRTTAGGARESYDFFDSHGQVIQKQVLAQAWYPTFDSFIHTWSVTATRYDAMGRAYQKLPATAFNQGGPFPITHLGYIVDPFSGNGTTLTHYNTRGMLDAVIEPNGYATQHYQDIDVATPYHTGTYLLLQGTTGPDGQARHNVYDAAGNLVLVREWDRDMDGNYLLEGQTQYAYDIHAKLTEITDTHGNTYTTHYDRMGRKIEMVDPDLGPNRTWKYAYNGAGNIISQVDGRNVAFTQVFDGLDRLISKSWTTGFGAAEESFAATYTYDNDINAFQGSFGQLIRVVDMDGSERNYVYDDWGRLYSRTEDLAGRFAPYAHAVSAPTLIYYNEDDQPECEIRPDYSMLNFTYNGENGEPQSVEATMASEVESFESQPLSDVWTVREYATHTNGTIQATGTDNNTHLALYRDDAPRAVSFDFMAGENIDGAIYLSSGKWGTSAHRRWSLTMRPDGPDTFKLKAYRMVGTSKETKETFAYGLQQNTWYRGILIANEDTNSYQMIIYNAQDSNARITFEDAVSGDDHLGYNNEPIRFAMDIRHDQLSLDNVALLQKPQTLAKVLAYDHQARPLKMDIAGGLTRTTSYYTWQEGNNLLAAINVSRDGITLLEQSFTYDGLGNVSTVEDYQQMDGTDVLEGLHDYSYDDLNRLISATSTSQGQTLQQSQWQYDPLGNIEIHTDGLSGTQRNYSYGYQSGPHAVDAIFENGVQVQAFAYDDNGNTTDWGSAALTWRGANQPAALNLDDTTWTYYYNGNQERTFTETHTSGSFTGADLILNGIERSFDANHSLTHTRHQIRLGKMLIGTWENGELSIQHADHLGSQLMTTTATTGDVVYWERFKPFGASMVSGGTDRTDLDFTGQRKDTYLAQDGSEPYLLDYNARRYDPNLGRFISPDPIIPDITNPQALNRYSYVYNNPIRYNDPTGHFPGDDFIKCVEERCQKSVWISFGTTGELDASLGGWASHGWILAYNYESGTLRIGKSGAFGGSVSTPDGAKLTQSILWGTAHNAENNGWVSGSAFETGGSGALDLGLRVGYEFLVARPLDGLDFLKNSEGEEVVITGHGLTYGGNLGTSVGDAELTVSPGTNYTIATPEIPFRAAAEAFADYLVDLRTPNVEPSRQIHSFSGFYNALANTLTGNLYAP